MLFNRMDRNRDGLIAASEVGTSWSRYSRFDTNEDKLLTALEYVSERLPKK